MPPHYAHLFQANKAVNGFDPVGGNRAQLMPDANATIDCMSAGGTRLRAVGVAPQIRDLLAHADIIDAIGKDNIFPARRVMTASID